MAITLRREHVRLVTGILRYDKEEDGPEPPAADWSDARVCVRSEGNRAERAGTVNCVFLIQESMETMGGLHAELLNNPIEWKDGFITPSRRPGPGYDLNKSAAQKYVFQIGRASC